MDETDLYARNLGVETPWRVTDVTLTLPAEVVVRVEHTGETLCDPTCGEAARRYDHRPRRRRRLDTCPYQTIPVADVPRAACEAHGVKQIEMPRARPNARFAALFEGIVIHWLREVSIAAAARRSADGTRYLRLRRPRTVPDQDWNRVCAVLRKSTLRTVRAWAIKESAMTLWDYRSRGWAERGRLRW